MSTELLVHSGQVGSVPTCHGKAGSEFSSHPQLPSYTSYYELSSSLFHKICKENFSYTSSLSISTWGNGEAFDSLVNANSF